MAALIPAVNAGSSPWITHDANEGHLNYYFWLLAALMLLDFLFFIYIARKYEYRSASPFPSNANAQPVAVFLLFVSGLQLVCCCFVWVRNDVILIGCCVCRRVSIWTATKPPTAATSANTNTRRSPRPTPTTVRKTIAMATRSPRWTGLTDLIVMPAKPSVWLET